MKIAYDATSIQDQYGFRGIGRCAREILLRFLLHAVAKPTELSVAIYGFEDFESLLACLPLTKIQLQLINNSSNIEFFSLGPIVASSPFTNLRLFYGTTRGLLAQIAPDMVFMPYFERIVPLDYPTTVLVHDAIPLRIGKYSGKGVVMNWLKGLYYKWAWRRQRAASRLIAVSRSTKKDVLDFGLPVDKIDVVYNGLSTIFMQDINQEFAVKVTRQYDVLPGEYFLYDSGVEANKRPELLLQVFIQLQEHFPETKLVITGRSFARDGLPRTEVAQSFVAEVEKLGVREQIVFTDGIPEEDLRALMEKAKAYINLSGDEGFGFGPLQAMAVGSPAIIASDNTAFVELSSKYALLINPLELEATSAGAAKELQDLDSEFLDTARTYARGFTWEEHFRQLWPIILKAANGK
jgi:glycosyltransferase involved in cell wall biosynthesis